nr:hypothetical protein [Tanacetum cinerariifolium]
GRFHALPLILLFLQHHGDGSQRNTFIIDTHDVNCGTLEREERGAIRSSQITTPTNPVSNISLDSQTHPVTPVYPDAQAVDVAFVMANYSRLYPLMSRRMSELRLQGVATHLGNSSKDVDDEIQMEAPRGFQSQPQRGTGNQGTIWKAFRGNTRDLDSISEETRQDCNSTRRCSTNAYDGHLGNLGMLNNKVDSPSLQSIPQVLLSFEVHTPPATYLKEVKETLGIPMEVEPMDQMKLKDIRLDTCNHNIPLSSREVFGFDESEPQPQPLSSCPSLDVSIRDERGSEPPIKPHSLDSFWMKVIDPLTIHTPPSPHVACFYPKDVYCYYHPCIDDPKKHYGFKPGLIGSLTKNFLNLEVIENDFLGEGLSLPIKPKELENSRIKETHQLEHIIKQPLIKQ